MSQEPGRRHVWGDDPEERDASATIAEYEASPGSRQERRWHDHKTLFPFKVVGGFIGRNAKRVAVTIAGFAVMLAGVALLILPGPGWLLIFLGLGILATEYVWAQRLLNKAKEQAMKAKDLALGKKQQRAEKKEARRAARRAASSSGPNSSAPPGDSAGR